MRLQQFFGGSMIRDSKVFRRAVRANFNAAHVAFSEGDPLALLKQGRVF